MTDYIIKIHGVNNGKHIHCFNIKDDFFENFNNSEITHANIIANVTLKKTDDKLSLSIKIYGKINNLLCDLCAEKITINISSETTIIIVETNEDLPSTDDIIYVKTNEKEVNISHLLFELITLSLPNKRRHELNEDKSSECDKEMLKLIKAYSTKKKTSDSRWNVLKDLKITQ